MREIGSIRDRKQAERFGDYLIVKGIENRIDEDEDGGYAVWILDEEQMDEARELMDEYLADPDSSEYRKAAKKAEDIREEERREEEQYRERMKASRVKMYNRTTGRMGDATKILIGISVVVFLLQNLNVTSVVRLFYISEYIRPTLPEIFSGQVWRLVTPIFLHFGILHILFNLYWLHILGSQMEYLISPRYFVVFVIVTAMFSNTGQYLLSGPQFGGMSGVVYGLLGYAWIRGKFDPASGFFLDRFIVGFMIVWFFLGVFGIIGNIANAAHGVGLAVGMVWGYLAAQHANIKRQM